MAKDIVIIPGDGNIEFYQTGGTSITSLLTLNDNNFLDLSGSLNVSGSLQVYGNPVLTSVDIDISGTTNYIPKFTNSTSIGDSVIYQNGSNIGIGTTDPVGKFSVKPNPSYVGQISIDTYSSIGVAPFLKFSQYNSTSDANSFKLGMTNSHVLQLLSFNDTVIFSATNQGLVMSRLILSTAGATYAPAITMDFTIGDEVGLYVPGGLGSKTLGFITDRLERIRIDADGNVGIANTSPSYKLDVTGDGRFTEDILVNGITVGRGNGSVASNLAVGLNSLSSITTGYINVGIGSSALLNNTSGYGNVAIGSNSMLNNTIGIRNVAIGEGALYTNSTAYYNVAIGRYALYYNNASSNTAIGESALQYNTTGANNTAIGRTSLLSNVIGNSNVGIGIGTLYFNTSGSSNVAIGTSTLYKNISGNHNVALGTNSSFNNVIGSHNFTTGYYGSFNNVSGSNNISIGYFSLFGSSVENGGGNYSNNIGIGNSAGYTITTGQHNIFLGTDAGFAVTSGTYNIAFGYQSQRYSQDTDHNISIGYQTLFENLSGSHNVALGYQSLFGASNANDGNYNSNIGLGYRSGFNITTGLSNQIIGRDAGYTLTTGNYNILLGHGAGYDVTTGDNNVIIGRSADVISGTDTNSIVIGYNAVGLGSDTISLGNSSITKTVINAGNLGVGTTDPSEKLDVNGNTKSSQFISTATTGTAPLQVLSTTLVSNLNADLLDGYEASTIIKNVAFSESATDLPIGWYTIATNSGNRAIGRFGIRDAASGRHQSTIFYASHHYSSADGSHLYLLSNSVYAMPAQPYSKIRLKENGTYDGAALQVYVSKTTSSLTCYLLGDEFQSSGWVLKDWIPDATDPGGVSNYAGFSTASEIDFTGKSNVVINAGDIYAGTKTNQYRVLTTADEGSGNGLNADTLDGLHSSSFLRSDVDDNMSGTLTFLQTGANYNAIFYGTTAWRVSESDIALQRVDARNDATNYSRLHWYGMTDTGATSNFRHAWYDGNAYVNIDVSNSNVNFTRATGIANLQVHGNTVWHAGNDGPSSGLNADLLDGVHASELLSTSSISGTDNYIPMFNGTSAIENSVIYQNGTNIGIGTNSPTTKLQIIDDINSDLVYSIKNENTGGLSRCGYRLTNSSNYNANILLTGPNYTAVSGWDNTFIIGVDSAINNGVFIYSPNKIRLGNNTSGLVHIVNSTIGIDTTSPTDLLHINGSQRIENGSLYFKNSTKHGFIPFPDGAWCRGPSSSETGAIKITLPFISGTPADMMTFWVDILDYATNESVSLYIAAYSYQAIGGDTWYNPTAIVFSKLSSKDYTVRFGDDGTNKCIWIGEITSSWGYPQVIVRDFQGGHDTDITQYKTGWNISITGSLGTINETVSGNFPQASNSDTLDNQEGTYYTNASNINAGTIGDAYLPATISSDITGNAATATKLATARTITLSGDVTGNTSFDGSSNVTITTTVANDSHTHDTRYYTETESDARFLGISAKAVDSDKLDNLDSSQFLRSDVADVIGSLGTGRVQYSAGGDSNTRLWFAPRNSTDDGWDFQKEFGWDSNISSWYFDEDLTIGRSIMHGGDTNTYLQFNAEDSWRVVTGGTERLEISTSEVVINDGGNDFNFRIKGQSDTYLFFSDANVDRIGIGTSSPSAKLHVFADSNGTHGTVKAIKTDNTDYTSIDPEFGLILNRDVAYISNRKVGGDILIRTSITESYDNTVITIKDNGKVGIGTTTPTYKLDINDDGTTGAGLRVIGGGSGTALANFTRNVGGTGEINILAANSDPQIQFYDQEVYFSIGLDDSENAFKISNNTNIGTNDIVTVKTSGNVGIGTTSPLSDLDIVGSGSVILNVQGSYGTLFSVEDDLTDSLMSVNDIAGLPVFEVFADDTIIAGRYNQNDFYLDGPTGYIGLGTSSPINKLHIFEDSTGTSTTTGVTIEQSGSGDSLLQFLLSSQQRWVMGIDNSDNNSFKISSTAILGIDDRFIIETSGDIGIGTTSPSYKLDVAGSIRSTSQLISTVATGTSPLSVSSTTLVSNLNSDLLDGVHAYQFLRSDVADTISAALTFGAACYLGSSGIGRLVFSGNGDSNTRTYFAPRNAGDTDWNFNAEFGWDGNNQHWYFDTIPYAAGNAVLTTTSISGTDNYIPMYNGANTLEESVIYQNSSNIGVNVTSPSTRLDVDGTITARSANILRASDGTNTLDFLRRSSHSTGGFGIVLGSEQALAIGSGESTNQIQSNVDLTTNEILYLASDQVSTSDAIKILTGLQNGWANRVEAITIRGNGYTGFLNTSPVYPVDVSGIIHTKTGSSDVFIGNDSSNGAIEIAGGNPYIDFKDSTGEDYDVRLQRAGNNYFRILNTTYGEMFTVRNDNVGINQPNPLTKLHVVGGQSSFTNGQGQDEGIFLIPENSQDSNGGGRIFFKENASNLYGCSIGYLGSTTNNILNWVENSFNISMHDNNISGALAMTVTRGSTPKIGFGTNDVADARVNINAGGTSNIALGFQNCDALKTTSSSGRTLQGYLKVYVDSSVNGFTSNEGEYYIPLYS